LKNVRIRIYKAIILLVVLYGYETWSLTLREEHRLRVFENRRIFGPMRDEVMGGWRKLHKEKLHDLYSSLKVIRMIKFRRMRWSLARSMNGGEEECILVIGLKVRGKEVARKTKTYVGG
jgi:hypothetical protein